MRQPALRALSADKFRVAANNCKEIVKSLARNQLGPDLVEFADLSPDASVEEHGRRHASHDHDSVVLIGRHQSLAGSALESG